MTSREKYVIKIPDDYQEGRVVVVKDWVRGVYGRMREIFSAEQSIYILVLEFFYAHLRKCGYGADSTGEKVQEGQPFFLEKNRMRYLMQDIESYEVKEAVCMLEDMVEWGFLQRDEQAGSMVVQVEKELTMQALEEKRTVGEILLQLLEAAGQESPLVRTPETVSRLIVSLLDSSHVGGRSICEICCGSAGFGLEVLKWMEGDSREETGLAKAGGVSYYGEDIRPFCVIFARILLWLSGVKNFDVVMRDSLKFSAMEQEEGHIYGPYDMIFADLPVGSNRNQPVDWKDARMGRTEKSSVYAEWIFLQDVLYRLAGHGQAFVLATRGALVRKHEKQLREWVMEQDWLEAVITLPANLYSEHNLGRELIIFNKNKRKNGKVLFADLSSFCERISRNHCEITDEGIAYLQDLMNDSKTLRESEISHLADKTEIEDAEFSWNPYVYLHSKQMEDFLGQGVFLERVATITRGIQLSKDEEMRLQKEGTYAFLNIRNIERGRIVENDCIRIRKKTPLWTGKYQIQEDDIVMTCKGTQVKLAIVPPNPPQALIGGNLTIVRVDQEFYHPYILYEFLKSEWGERSLERIQTGTTIKLMNSSNIGKIRIPQFKADHMRLLGDKLKQLHMEYERKQQELRQKYECERKALLPDWEDRKYE